MISDRTRQNLYHEFKHSPIAKVGVVLLVLIIIASTFAPMLAPHNPTEQSLEDRNQPPVGFTSTYTDYTMEDGEEVTEEVTIEGTWEYPLGTDPLGRDVLSRVIFGARTSMLVGILSTLLGGIVGIGIGLASGYYRGWIDDVTMRGVDVMLAIPGLVMAIVLYAVLGPYSINIPDPLVRLGLVNGMPDSFVFPLTVTVIIATVAVKGFARLARGEALKEREEEYIKATNSLGAKNHYVITRHIFPNVITPLLIYGTIRVAHAILTESTLSFLGFSGTTLSWGYDIALGRGYLATAWWVAMMPGLAIVLAVISINLIGDWFRDALDPDIDRSDT